MAAPELIVEGVTNPLVQVVAEGTKEILYTVRFRGDRFQPRVYSSGVHTSATFANLGQHSNVTVLSALLKRAKP